MSSKSRAVHFDFWNASTFNRAAGRRQGFATMCASSSTLSVFSQNFKRFNSNCNAIMLGWKTII